MSNVTTVTGAELKTTLEGLGIPAPWFAEYVGVSGRSVFRWFDGTPIPQRITDELARLHVYTADEVARVCSQVLDGVEQMHPGDSTVVLNTYRTDDEAFGAKSDLALPASWFRNVAFRAMEHLRANGYVVRIEYA